MSELPRSAERGRDCEPPPVLVVAAAILDGRRLLAARRSAPARVAGGWELPGGKVEPGEDAKDALVRECREELGVEVRLRRRIGGEWPLGPAAVLHAWTAALVSGTPQPLQDHDLIAWLEFGSWYSVTWLAADLPVVDALRDHLGPLG